MTKTNAINNYSEQLACGIDGETTSSASIPLSVKTDQDSNTSIRTQNMNDSSLASGFIGASAFKTGGGTQPEAFIQMGSDSYDGVDTGTIPRNRAVFAGNSAALGVSFLINSSGKDFNWNIGDSGSVIKYATLNNTSFVYSASKSAGTSFIEVDNTSDTVNSYAGFKAQVAGSTAADAYVNLNISGGQNWTLGLDNSDSDSFVIAASANLGTTNVQRIATTGEITYPLQSSFRAYLSASANNVTGNGTVYTLACNTESYDRNSDYNNATFVFTAPVAGIYRFDVSCFTVDHAIGTSYALSLRNSAGTELKRLFQLSPLNVMDASNQICMSGTADLSLAASDTVKATIVVSGEVGDTVDVQGGSVSTVFSGWLMG